MSASVDVPLASTPEDLAALETLRHHHAELAAGLAARVRALLEAADRAGQVRIEPARTDLVSFCRRELLPHAQVEESTLYRGAAELPELRTLVGVMTSEHLALQELVEEIPAARTAVRAAVAARALEALFGAHLSAENDVLLPRLAADPTISLADLLEQLHREVAERTGRAHTAAGGPSPAAVQAMASPGGCGCGGTDDAVPELDVRAIPHAIRHATVIGALEAVPPAGSLVLVAPHDPQPLLRQLTERAGGRLRVEYLECGPDAWRLRLTR